MAGDFPSQPVARAVLTTVASSGPVLRGCSLLLAKPNAMGTGCTQAAPTGPLSCSHGAQSSRHPSVGAPFPAHSQVWGPEPALPLE